MELILPGIVVLIVAGILWVNVLRSRRVLTSDVTLGDSPQSITAELDPRLRPTNLFWNLRLRTDAGPQTTTTVDAGRTYTLETAIEVTSGGQYSAVDFRLVLERRVTFEIIGEGLRFRLAGTQDWLAGSILSPPFLCHEAGTSVFAVEWQARQPGPVLITAVLAVDGQLLKQQTIRVRAVGEISVLAVDADEVWTVQGNDLVLHAIRRDPQIDLTLEQPQDEALSGALTAVADEEAAALNNLVLKVRKELEQLSLKYPSNTVKETRLPDDTALKAVAHLGRQLYRAMFGVIGEGRHPGLDSLNNRLRVAPEGSRLAIDDGGAAFPWGILYDGDPDAIDVSRFWGVRFQLCRRVVTVDGADADPDTDTDTDPTDVGGTGVASTPATQTIHSFINPRVLDDVYQHQEAMEGTFAQHVSLGARGRSTDELRAWMSPDAAWQRSDLLYVFAHASVQGVVNVNGVPNGRWPETNAVLDLESSDDANASAGLTAAQMRELRIRSDRFDPLPDHPIAFINACSSGKPDAQCTLNPLVKLFVKRWGIPAFIGTDWATPQRFAAPFAEAVLTPMIEQGASVGEALWWATRAAVVDDSNPFALNYCLYGRPDRRL